MIFVSNIYNRYWQFYMQYMQYYDIQYIYIYIYECTRSIVYEHIVPMCVYLMSFMNIMFCDLIFNWNSRLITSMTKIYCKFSKVKPDLHKDFRYPVFENNYFGNMWLKILKYSKENLVILKNWLSYKCFFKHIIKTFLSIFFF